MHTVTSPSNPPLGRQRAKLSLPFSVPKEHGAVICFALSTVLAAKLGWSALDSLLLPFVALWLTLLLSRRPHQAFWFGIGAAAVLAILGDSASVAPLIALFGIGIRVTDNVASAFGVVWRELLGMIAVAAIPLLAATIASGAASVGHTATLAYTASAITAALMIHILRRDSQRIKPFIWVSVFFWMWLWAQEPGALFWCLMSFPMQLLLLLSRQKPSFKMLGILETVAMLFVTVYLWNIV